MTDDPVARMELYRLEQAEEALSDAKILIANNAGKNSILNRAYYAMFYAVLALAERKRFASSKHKGILAFFDKELVMTGTFPKEMSKNLHRAYDLRLKADYRPVVRVDDETVITRSGNKMTLHIYPRNGFQPSIVCSLSCHSRMFLAGIHSLI